MSTRLKGKIAVVTGATSGIGEATAEVFHREGATVVVSGRSRERGEALVARLGERAVFQRADVTRPTDIEALIAFTVEQFGRIDVLFNNAGGPTELGGVEAATPEGFEHGMNLLLGSVVFGMKYAVPHMREQGFGRIINNSSVAALRPGFGGYLYSAAKAAVTQITRLAGVELAPHGITVNSISPGGIATPVFYGGSTVADGRTVDHNAATMAKLRASLGNAVPGNVAGEAVEIANAALYLASDEGGFVNCHDLVVDGGLTSAPNT